MTRVLLDPSLVLALNGAQDWSRLSDWLSDRRVGLGASAWQALYERFYQGQLEVPSPMRKTVNQGISALLAREPLVVGIDSGECRLSAPYLGSEEATGHLLHDLSAVGDDASFALGTDLSFWGAEINSVGLIPPPPHAISAHFSPGMPSDEERRAARERWFSARRVLIVGGQVEQRIIASLFQEVGLDASRFTWVPSERRKKASNIDALIGGLTADAVVICIVGKVGHDVSGKMAMACKRNDLKLHQVESSSHLHGYLSVLAEDA